MSKGKERRDLKYIKCLRKLIVKERGYFGMKKILLFSVLFLLLFSFSKNAYAYTPPSPTCYTTFDHVNVNGTYNKLYFVDGSASAYVNLSINAMDSWVNSVARTGVNTRIYYNRTAVKADSLMDIYYNLNTPPVNGCLLYTSDAADDLLCV